MPEMVMPESITRAPILFLTGAGASVPLGRYTTLQFWDYIKAMLYRQLQGSDDRDYTALVQQLVIWGAPAMTDIEKVLSLLQRNASDADRFAGDPFFLKSVIGSNE